MALTPYRTAHRATLPLLVGLFVACGSPRGAKRQTQSPALPPTPLVFGVKGSQPGQFRKPDGIDIDKTGGIWVVDAGNERVQVFSPTGALRFQFGRPGIGPGKFMRLDGVFVHGPEVYLTDISHHRLQVFDLRGRFKRFLEFSRDGKVVPVSPISVRIHDDELYVVDPERSCIYVSDLAGRLLRRIAKRGSDKTGLLKPESMTFDSRGRIWIADEGNSRIQIYHRDGRHVASIGPQITANHYFSGDIEGLACSPDGLCFAVDETSGYIVAFDLETKFKFYLGRGRGNGPGQTRSADGLVYDRQRSRVIVADQGNHRVQAFSTQGPRYTKFPDVRRRGKNPRPFVVALVHDNPGRAIRKHTPLASYFGLRLSDYGFTGGRVLVLADHKQIAARLRTGSIHLFVASPYAAKLAADSGLFKPIVIGKKKGHWEYRSLIVVKQDSGITSLAQLAGKTLASEDPYSTSTFILPRMMLNQAGLSVVPENSPNALASAVRIKFTYEAKSIAWWIMRKDLLGGFFANTDFKEIKKHVPLRVLAKSGLVPRVIMLAHTSLKPEVVEAVTRIFGHLDRSTHKVVLKPIKISRFRKISSEEVDKVLALKVSGN